MRESRCRPLQPIEMVGSGTSGDAGGAGHALRCLPAGPRGQGCEDRDLAQIYRQLLGGGTRQDSKHRYESLALRRPVSRSLGRG